MSTHDKCKRFPVMTPQSDYGKILSDYRFHSKQERKELQQLKDSHHYEGKSTVSCMTNLKANSDLSLKRIDKLTMPLVSQDIYRFTKTYYAKW